MLTIDPYIKKDLILQSNYLINVDNNTAFLQFLDESLWTMDNFVAANVLKNVIIKLLTT